MHYENLVFNFDFNLGCNIYINQSYFVFNCSSWRVSSGTFEWPQNRMYCSMMSMSCTKLLAGENLKA